jgi:ribosomal protein S18 acetylase RimI-like enzyme
MQMAAENRSINSELVLRRIDKGEAISRFAVIRSSYPDGMDAVRRTEERLRVELSQRANRIAFIAELGGLDVAYVQLVTAGADNDPELADGVSIAHVHDLRVAHNHVGRGVGTNVMRKLEAYASQAGFRILTLGVDSWNERARGLYEKLGYVVFKEDEGEEPSMAVYYMRRALSD